MEKQNSIMIKILQNVGRLFWFILWLLIFWWAIFSKKSNWLPQYDEPALLGPEYDPNYELPPEVDDDEFYDYIEFEKIVHQNKD